MNRTAPSPTIAAEEERTRRRQADASDPAACAWVSANAGTGKTHVLALRVLRLLLAGTPPERILCLTYTKAAAAEMAQRVFGRLAEWVTAPAGKLGKTLTELMLREPTATDLARARTLFTAAIETPGGLKVQTIHAFCERLLQRFPLEAGVPPGFEILDEDVALRLRREAIDAVLLAASRAPGGQLGNALATAIAYAVEDHFDEVLAAALEKRKWLETAIRLDRDHGSDDPWQPAAALLRSRLGAGNATDAAAIERSMAGVLGVADLKRLRDALSGGSKTDVKWSDTISAALVAVEPAQRVEALGQYLLTGKGEPRDRLMTKPVADAHPDLEAIARRAQECFAALMAEKTALDVTVATLALYRLADAVLQRYRDAKARRAALDFDDLIAKTVHLLGSRESADWVLYKLDGGLDHILVDESQDTSPEQWQVVEALAREFFAGAGAREESRTLFAVGDEKQSIYSFQGAAPEKFAEMGERFAAMARSAGAAWRSVPLHLSFRTVVPILAAVDEVFADEARTPGLTADRQSLQHVAWRTGHAGLIEIWPPEASEDTATGDVWSPYDEAASPAPAVRLANRIADTIKGWLDGGDRLQSEDRTVRAGDILILVRKRQPFAAPMVAALKARGIAVAGADRIRLADQLAVQDLLALGDFLTLPEDDLALACVLKSPLIGLDDDDLMAIAHGRKGSLWKSLLDNAGTEPRYAQAADMLKRHRKAADFSPPFEFFAKILDAEGMRTRLLARLGPDAADAIDELLNLALTYDDGAPPSLAGFLHWLRQGKREIKRDMEHGRDEVRVMTVHGAKGLEAPIVFLPDTCWGSSAGRQKGGVLELPDDEGPSGEAAPFVWPVKGSSSLPAIKDARAARAATETAERNRLLYVAMTRARDRLYVAGFDGKSARAQDCWYEHIVAGLADRLVTAPGPGGMIVRRRAADQTAEPVPSAALLAGDRRAETRPAWASARAPREPQLAVPLAPSQLVPYETDASGDPLPEPPPRDVTSEPVATSPATGAADGRFLRGTLTHQLLEHLPMLEPGLWPKAARAFVAARARGLSMRTKASIVDEALAVLADPRFRDVFGTRSRAEVSIVAEIPRPGGRGPALRLTGQIDRLAEIGEEVVIVDYKTNRPPPQRTDGIAEAYLLQLAAYRLAAAQIYPGRRVRAAILWTDGPRIMEIPSSLLDTYASRLWELDPGRLDG